MQVSDRLKRLTVGTISQHEQWKHIRTPDGLLKHHLNVGFTTEQAMELRRILSDLDTYYGSTDFDREYMKVMLDEILASLDEKVY